VKTIRDQAQAFAAYARERGYGLQAINDAAEIKIRAERRMGELIPILFPRGKRSISSHYARLSDCRKVVARATTFSCTRQQSGSQARRVVRSIDRT
jgi:hypothetical protein